MLIALKMREQGHPEHVGGPWSQGIFLDAIRDDNDEYQKTNLRWAGGHFDPEWVDLALINKDLRNAFCANIRRLLHQPKPKTT
jgi:hypothetical protein